jgi:hypothetical protein
MIYDRFDIVEAYYAYLVDYHLGQYSKEYIRLCKIRKYFKPNFNLHYDSLTKNGRLIYDNLESKIK